MAVTREQRYTGDHPCPICGGWELARRHTGKRCYGYTATGGHSAICTRAETAGYLKSEDSVGGFRHSLHGLCGCGVTHGGQTTVSTDRQNGAGPEQHYELRTVDGTLIAEHVRYYRDGGKDFCWQVPGKPRGPLHGISKASLPLYGTERLADLADRTWIVLTEGEKCADELRGVDIPSVGTATGASSIPDDASLAPLARLRVMLWPDNDADGQKHMERNGARLLALGCSEIRMVTWSDAPEHGDAADFIATHGGSDALIDLLNAAQPFAVGADVQPPATSTPIGHPALVIRRSREDLKLVRLPDWKLPGEVLECGYHLIYGPSGTGKSTYASDRALRLAAQGENTLYVATEDMAGLNARVTAWELAHPTADIGSFNWLELPNGLNLVDTVFVDAIIATFDTDKITHVTIDTLRQSYLGDENSSEIGSRLNAAVQAFIRAGASVDVVHHTGHNESRPRGTTSVFNNTDAVFSMKIENGTVTLHADKLRAEAAPDRLFLLRSAETGLANSEGWPLHSTLLVPTDDSELRARKLSPSNRKVLDAFGRPDFADGGTRITVTAATGIGEREAFRALRALFEAGYLAQDKKGQPYTLSDLGRRLVGSESRYDSEKSASASPTGTYDSGMTGADSHTDRRYDQLSAPLSDCQSVIPDRPWAPHPSPIHGVHAAIGAGDVALAECIMLAAPMLDWTDERARIELLGKPPDSLQGVL